MSVPPRPLAKIALLLVVLASLLTACGEDDTGLLSAGRAERLQDDLDAIERFVGEGRCDAAEGRLDSLTAKVRDLPRSVDPELRERLEEGATTLAEQVPEDCRADEPAQTTEETVPETTPPETVPPETTPPETVPPETTPPETVPPETVPPETVPPETVPPETVPPETTPVEPEPGDSGGEEAPLGQVDG